MFCKSFTDFSDGVVEAKTYFFTAKTRKERLKCIESTGIHSCASSTWPASDSAPTQPGGWVDKNKKKKKNLFCYPPRVGAQAVKPIAWVRQFEYKIHFLNLILYPRWTKTTWKRSSCSGRGRRLPTARSPSRWAKTSKRTIQCENNWAPFPLTGLQLWIISSPKEEMPGVFFTSPALRRHNTGLQQGIRRGQVENGSSWSTRCSCRWPPSARALRWPCWTSAQPSMRFKLSCKQSICHFHNFVSIFLAD